LKLFPRACIAAAAALLLASPGGARPIVYAHSTTVMADYSADVMREAQISYAPRYYWSFGLGHVEFEGHGAGSQQEITFGRLNFLAKRWNFEAAQANVFVWGGAGNVRTSEWIPEVTVPGDPGEHDHGGGSGGTTVPGYERNLSDIAWNAGAQVDYETRRIYTAIRTDAYQSSIFEHRTDTFQFGVAPYKHDTNTLATWLVASATRYSSAQHDETEYALLLRLFRKRAWIEAGATLDGKLRARAMFSL